MERNCIKKFSSFSVGVHCEGLLHNENVIEFAV